MIEKLASLIEVKKIIALLLCVTFIILALTKVIDGNSFTQLFLIIIGFYFGQSSVRQTLNENK